MGSRRARQEAQTEEQEEEEEKGDYRRKARAVKQGQSRHPKGQNKNKEGGPCPRCGDTGKHPHLVILSFCMGQAT